MKKLSHYIPTIKFNKYVCISIIILFIFLIGRVKRQQDGGIKIGNTMLLMGNYDRQVNLSAEQRSGYEAEVKKYDDLINKSTGTPNQDWLLQKAENLSYLGENNSAIKTIYTTLGYYPDSLQALDMLATIYAQVGAYQYALDNYNKIIAKDPTQKTSYAKQIIRVHIGLKDADTAGKLYIQYIKDGGTADTQLINQIRKLRNMQPLTN